MKYTHGKILKALKIIKTTCVESGGCKTCPLGDRDESCYLRNFPSEWDIKEEPEWKAFRD